MPNYILLTNIKLVSVSSATILKKFMIDLLMIHYQKVTSNQKVERKGLDEMKSLHDTKMHKKLYLRV